MDDSMDAFEKRKCVAGCGRDAEENRYYCKDCRQAQMTTPERKKLDEISRSKKDLGLISLGLISALLLWGVGIAVGTDAINEIHKMTQCTVALGSIFVFIGGILFGMYFRKSK